jgi:hypothetical protein
MTNFSPFFRALNNFAEHSTSATILLQDAAVQLKMHSIPCCHAAGVSIDARRCCAAGGTIKAAMLCCVVSLLAMHVAGSWLNLQSQMRCLAATTIETTVLFNNYANLLF